MKAITYGLATLLFCLVFMLSCNNGDKMKVTGKWEALSQQKIYFGHQSVGFNIVDGIKDIMKENEKLTLNIKETSDPKDFSAPIFAHSRVGQNTDLKSKIEAFEQTINQGIGEKADIAFFKFCYVDIKEQTDVRALFASYQQTIDNLQKTYPDTVFLYATVPLRTVETTWKTWIKKKLGKDHIWEYADNIKRNEFNEMLRNEYGDTNRLFDIAHAESTNADGKSETFTFKGVEYEALIPEYTDDGGHLNATGRRQVAKHLLTVMAGLQMTGDNN